MQRYMRIGGGLPSSHCVIRIFTLRKNTKCFSDAILSNRFLDRLRLFFSGAWCYLSFLFYTFSNFKKLGEEAKEERRK